MKPQRIPEAIDVSLKDIMPFVSRARDQAGFEQLKGSIAKYGLKRPIGLRDITHLPPDERRRPDGGLYKYQRVWGEGRILAHEELGKSKIPAIIGAKSEAEVVGAFLSENIIREKLPWVEQAKLVESELRAGRSAAEIAVDLCVSEKHIQKLARILSKTASGIEDEVRKMPVNAAEVLTALPAEHQTIIVETLRETGEREVQAIVRKAREITDQGGELSKSALTKSIQRVDDDLKKMRDKLKLTRLHASLGPQNLALLLEDPKFRKACEKENIPLAKFLKTVN